MSSEDRKPDRTILRGLQAEQRYRPLGLLGEGAVGRVERVYDAHLGRIVARKTLREELVDRPGSIRTFVHEARILACLDHGGVIPIFDAQINEAGLPVYTMREISGRSLMQVLQMDRRTARVEPLSLGRTLKIWIQLCQALGHAHGRGVVHLDLKPQNIIVLPHDEVVLVDWGAASIYDPEGYARAQAQAEAFLPLDVREFQSDEFIVGTPRYMSPEQTVSARSTLVPASDIFSLGILFYQMLTGEIPFRGESLEELLFHVRETPITDPRERVPGIHARLAQLVMQMLEKDPEQRPRDLDAVLGELESFRGLGGAFPLRHFEAGRPIFREGEDAQRAFVIVEGEVEIWTEQGGTRQVLGRHVSGETFGELALFSGEPRSACATALVATAVREISRSALEAETGGLSPWVRSVLSGMAERFVDRSDRLIELLGDPPEN
jgi:serine/threonine protein kinase